VKQKQEDNNATRNQNASPPKQYKTAKPCNTLNDSDKILCRWGIPRSFS